MIKMKQKLGLRILIILTLIILIILFSGCLENTKIEPMKADCSKQDSLKQVILCKTINNVEFKYGKDYSNCKEEDKDSCFYNFAVATGRPDLCDKLSSELRENCNGTVAIITENERLCEKINSGENKLICVGAINKDLSICNTFTEGLERKNACLEGIKSWI